MSEVLGLLVIGGGAAGLAAARGYRDAGGEGAVAIITDEHRMPYRRPPLTKELLRGELDETELALEEERWLSDRDVRLISGRAVSLDPVGHEVRLSGGRRLGYRRCVLATGAEPTRLPVPGADDPAVRVVRSLEDVRELLARLRSDGSAVVIGSGFIGCEIASSLRNRGVSVTLVSVESAPNESRLGQEVGERIAEWLQGEGVRLVLGQEVESIERQGARLTVHTASASPSAGVVVMATGVSPRSELLLATGLPLVDGAVPTDSALRTALPDTLAAGDVCLADNAAAGRPLRVEHWGDALTQGRLAGQSAAGQSARWDEVPGFWSAIGEHTLKYAAWGDGHDTCRPQAHGDGAFTVWYGRAGRVVGVLTHRADEDYEQGRQQIADGAPWL
jgi:3-phenylpropionate/trans-cinnamate dioxygenase ferredoxin reductase subunit